jgi:class 3 adenylate cyclase
MKDGQLHEWVPGMLRVFEIVRVCVQAGFGRSPLKSIGDELMYYIPEREIRGQRAGALGLLEVLYALAGEGDPVFAEVKIAACHCRDAYDITFLPNTADVYGKDIDLTARLLQLAGPREIVMNEAFGRETVDEYAQIGNQAQFAFIRALRGPSEENLKGFAGPVPGRCPVVCVTGLG